MKHRSSYLKVFTDVRLQGYAWPPRESQGRRQGLTADPWDRNGERWNSPGGLNAEQVAPLEWHAGLMV
jgi:hypothetical protein